MTTAQLEQFEKDLEQRCKERSWCTGCQISAIQRGRTVVEIAIGSDGLGREISADSVFAIYCAGKPITALGIGTLIDMGELSFDDCLRDVMERDLNPALAALTIEQLLSHTAGLWRVPATAFHLLSPAERERLLMNLIPRNSEDPLPTYAEFASWELLRYVIEGVSGEPFEQYVTSRVLDPLGLRDEVFFSRTRGGLLDRKLRLNVEIRNRKVLPLLWERSSSNIDDAKAASGAMSSMRALSKLYDSILAVLSGAGPGVITRPTAARMTSPSGPPSFDRVLGRVCQFGLGFMVDLRAHLFSDSLSPNSFGHSGLSGMTFAGADRTRHLAFAVHVNGLVAHDSSETESDHLAQVRRNWIAGNLIAAIDMLRPQ